MTPKEKAKELVNKFRPYSYSSDGLNSMEREYQIEDNSKQCAFVAVDEIINTHQCDGGIDYDEMRYWEEVKQEINNL